VRPAITWLFGFVDSQLVMAEGLRPEACKKFLEEHHRGAECLGRWTCALHLASARRAAHALHRQGGSDDPPAESWRGWPCRCRHVATVSPKTRRL
jgi:hypothetical protein